MEGMEADQVINIYCDESCHLEHDGQPLMVLGAVWCPADVTRAVFEDLRAIKAAHGLSPQTFEAKWTKVSPAKLELYEALVDYFFATDALCFRGLVATDKSELDHERYGQDHDTWYYKMYFQMLQPILDISSRHRIYLDIKDTRSSRKIRKLWEVLSNSLHDFDRYVIERIQVIRSHEVEIMQLTDLLIGALCYANRGPSTSPDAKLRLVCRVEKGAGRSLEVTSPLGERKFNVFVWEPGWKE